MTQLITAAVAAVLMEAMLPSGSMKQSAEKLISLAAASAILELIIIPLFNFLKGG
ncbi:MAG: hypothetical protein MR684_03010 [Clostridium sp.]|nr:hypothetical protein [Clostridium sp.]